MILLSIFVIYFLSANACCEVDAQEKSFTLNGKDFIFPSNFIAKNNLANDLLNSHVMAQLCVHYGSWKPCGISEDINGSGGHDIFIIWLSAGKSKADFFIKLSPENFNPKRVGYPYHWERVSGGKVLYEMHKNYTVTRYIFKADDGVSVLVNGIGSKSPIYEVHRELLDGIQLQYIYRKNSGSDYKKTDLIVSGWVKSFLVVRK